MYNRQHVNELLEYSNLQNKLDYYSELKENHNGDDEELDYNFLNEEIKSITRRMEQILVD